MPTFRRKVVKIVVLELLQWAALATAVFVTAQKYATTFANELYWVVIATSIGCVAGLTLLIWFPVKLFFQWKKWWLFREGEWCPSLALYFVMGVIPCTVMMMVGIQSSYSFNNAYFQSVCTEILVIMLLVVDISEKLKTYKLRSDEENEEEVAGIAANGSSIRQTSGAYSMMQEGGYYSSTWGNKTVIWSDQRPQGLFENFLAAYDVRLVLEMADVTVIGYNWYYAIYVLSTIALATFVVTKQSKYKGLFDLLLMEFPFFCLRLSILCVFQNITRVLFLLKNFAFIFIFIYFWAIRPNVFQPKAPRRIAVNTVESTVPNHDTQINQEYHQDYDSRSRADTFDDDYNEGYGQQDDGAYYGHQEYQAQQQTAPYQPESSGFAQHPPSLLNHQESNGISVHYSLNDNYSHENREDENQPARYDYDHTDGDNVDRHHQMPYSDAHDGPVGAHEVRRMTRKSFRKSIIKSDVFSPPTEENHELEHSATEVEYPYATVNKINSRRQAAPERPPSPSPLQNEVTAQAELPSSSNAQDENASFPPPPDFPTATEHTVGPHKYSLRNSKYTPAVAAQLAQEAIKQADKSRNYDDESFDVPL